MNTWEGPALVGMSDAEARRTLEAEFPEWIVFRSAFGTCSARWREDPDITIHAQCWLDVRDGIIAAKWNKDHKATIEDRAAGE